MSSGIRELEQTSEDDWRSSLQHWLPTFRGCGALTRDFYPWQDAQRIYPCGVKVDETLTPVAAKINKLKYGFEMGICQLGKRHMSKVIVPNAGLAIEIKKNCSVSTEGDVNL